MKFTLGTILALVTLIGSILVAGTNFGEVRGSVLGHTHRINAVENRIKTIEEHIVEMNKRSIKIATDLEWIKVTITNMRLNSENSTNNLARAPKRHRESRQE